ncbi:MAG: DUF1572 family protein [Bacteroidetes bacterium]|nr:DUF1572 family protein [Bacteroidota bacterium]
MHVTPTQEFLSQSMHRIELNTPRIARCLEELSEEELWHRPNESSNSIGNLILHLCGNITQYIISSLGNGADNRERDKEFSTTSGYTKAELIAMLENTVNNAIEVIKDCEEEQLLKTRSVQGFNYSGIGNILHVTEHYSYHTGQIALLTKIMKNKDLGFYAGMDLNVKNQN